MDELYKMAGETGMSQSQAETAVGGIFSLIKDHVSAEHFETIAQNVPGLHDMVQKHQDSQTGNDNASNNNEGAGGLAGSLLGAFSAMSTSGRQHDEGASRGILDGSNGDPNFTSRDGATTTTATAAPMQQTQEATQETTPGTTGSTTAAASAAGTASSSTGQTTSSSTTTTSGAAATTAAAHNNSMGATMLESVFSSLAKGQGKGGIVGGMAKLVLFLQSQGITPAQLATFLPMVAAFVKKQFGVDVSHILGGSSSETSSTAPASSSTSASHSGGTADMAGKLMGMFMK